MGAAVGTVFMGALGLLAPERCARFVGLTALDRVGFGEFRATYGGLFVALGALPLCIGDRGAYIAVAAAWAGAAFGRAVSIIADSGWRERRAFAALALESAFAALLASGA